MKRGNHLFGSKHLFGLKTLGRPETTILIPLALRSEASRGDMRHSRFNAFLADTLRSRSRSAKVWRNEG